MPILIGTSTKNQKAIPIGETQMNRVYVGDKLVWQKPSGFTGIKYGALYNWYAAADSRKITSSDDWVVLSSTQYETLMLYLDPSGTPSSNIAGGKLKETGNTYWNSPNTNADNSSGMNVRGGGYRSELGVYSDILNRGRFWNTNEQYSTTAFHSYCLNNTGIFYTSNLNIGYTTYKKVGNSLRLIYTGSGTPASYTGTDGKVYRVVTLNGVTYLADNLAETKFRNGDWITGYNGGIYTPISNVNWAVKTTEAMCIYGDVESNMLL